jgi:DNA polymerase III, delta subunit
MNELRAQFESGSIYHAYSLRAGGAQGSVAAEVKALLEEMLGVVVLGNPDLHHVTIQSFGIEDSRRVKELHASKPMSERGRKIFIIEANSMTNEAQNSLLKVLEEPQAGAIFFLIVPAVEMLLPTVRSRIMIIGDQPGSRVRTNSDEIIQTQTAAKFLKMGMKDRIKFADDLAADISDEKAIKQDAIRFLDGLETVIHAAGRTAERGGVQEAETVRRLETLMKARDYARDRSPSLKQLLEYVALSV